MKNRIFDAVKNGKGKFVVVASTAVASTSAFAADPTANEAAINAAIASGQSMVSATTAGVIAVAAICFGVGLVVSWLRK